MSKDEKLIKKFQTNPLPNDIDFSDFKKYLEMYGFRLISVKGSHNLFTHDDIKEPYVIPTVNGRKVKPYYLKQINKIIKELEAK